MSVIIYQEHCEYLEKENEDKPERIAVMKVIYNGHIYVLTSFLQDLQDGLKEMFL